MYIIVGLGNPGIKYAETRHNMGFRTVDRLAEEYSIRVKTRKFRAAIGEGSIGGEKVILVKPQTFMNLSGEAVQQIVAYYKVPHDRLIVIYDDIDIPLGSVRVRKAGGPGTHNGMRSVVSCVKFTDFPRVRLGIGDAEGGEDLISHVIGKVSSDERRLLDMLASDGAAAVRDIIVSGIDKAMNIHNVRRDAQG